MASNSLLECIVYAKAASLDIIAHLPNISMPQFALPWDESQVTNSDEEIIVTHNWAELRRLMWDYVGIVRTNKRLERAKRRIELLKIEIQEYYGKLHRSGFHKDGYVQCSTRRDYRPAYKACAAQKARRAGRNSRRSVLLCK
jgi:L-aspartate oxidase